MHTIKFVTLFPNELASPGCCQSVGRLCLPMRGYSRPFVSRLSMLMSVREVYMYAHPHIFRLPVFFLSPFHVPLTPPWPDRLLDTQPNANGASVCLRVRSSPPNQNERPS